MRTLKDTRTKIFPSTTRGSKELPSSSALDSPSVLNRLATPPPAISSDMSQVIDDATSAMNDAIDLASTLLNETMLVGEFVDEQLAKTKELETIETDENYNPLVGVKTGRPRGRGSRAVDLRSMGNKGRRT